VSWNKKQTEEFIADVILIGNMMDTFQVFFVLAEEKMK